MENIIGSIGKFLIIVGLIKLAVALVMLIKEK